MATVGILVCDHFDDDVREIAGAPLDVLYGDMLGEHCRVYDATAHVLPQHPHECDGYILTGSRADAFADDPWIADLRQWIVRAVGDGERLVGVCFGHQVIAEALGGSVERADTWKAGPHQLQLDATAWFEEASVHINAMHRDVVTALPPGAVLAGTGETAAVASFRIAEQVLCVQDHPEFTHELTGFLVGARRARLGAEVTADAQERLATRPNDGATVARMLVDFLLDRRRT